MKALTYKQVFEESAARLLSTMGPPTTQEEFHYLKLLAAGMTQAILRGHTAVIHFRPSPKDKPLEKLIQSFGPPDHFQILDKDGSVLAQGTGTIEYQHQQELIPHCYMLHGVTGQAEPLPPPNESQSCL